MESRFIAATRRGFVNLSSGLIIAKHIFFVIKLFIFKRNGHRIILLNEYYHEIIRPLEGNKKFVRFFASRSMFILFYIYCTLRRTYVYCSILSISIHRMKAIVWKMFCFKHHTEPTLTLVLMYLKNSLKIVFLQ